MPELAHLAPTVRAEHERWAGAQFCPYAAVALLDMLAEQLPRAHAVV